MSDEACIEECNWYGVCAYRTQPKHGQHMIGMAFCCSPDDENIIADSDGCVMVHGSRCNARGAGVGHYPTTTTAIPDLIDAYFWYVWRGGGCRCMCA